MINIYFSWQCSHVYESCTGLFDCRRVIIFSYHSLLFYCRSCRFIQTKDENFNQTLHYLIWKKYPLKSIRRCPDQKNKKTTQLNLSVLLEKKPPNISTKKLIILILNLYKEIYQSLIQNFKFILLIEYMYKEIYQSSISTFKFILLI